MTTADRSWRLFLPLLVVLLAWGIGWYWETAVAMGSIWARSETFAHGFVVPPIALWLVWRQRGFLSGLSPRPWAWMLLPLAAAGGVWLLGELAAVNAVTQAALVAVLALTVMVLTGPQVSGAIAFPLAFLFFAVPIGEFALPQLMEWTADFTVLGLRLTGIPVYREGLQFVIPSGNWSVVEACSGVRYLIASLMVGTLFAYLNYRSLRRRLIFILVSGIVPIVANWVRAYLIVMLGHLSGNRLAVGADHLIYGWIFFGIVIMIMFAIGARWSENVPADAPPPPPLRPVAGPSPGAWVVVAAAVAIALPPIARTAVDGQRIAAVPSLAVPFSRPLAAWTADGRPATVWEPAFAEASARVNASYGKDGQRIGLYVAYYRNQDYDRKLVSSNNVLVKSGDPRWVQISRGSREAGVDGASVKVKTALLRPRGDASLSGGRMVVWQWYWINGRLTADDGLAKAYLALSRLLGEGDDSAAVVLYAPEDQPGGGEAALTAFVAEAGGGVNAALKAVRSEQ